MYIHVLYVYVEVCACSCVCRCVKNESQHSLWVSFFLKPLPFSVLIFHTTLSLSLSQDPSSVAAPPTNATPSGVPLNPIQQSPSIQATSFNLPFENWVYQAQAAAVYRYTPTSTCTYREN